MGAEERKMDKQLTGETYVFSRDGAERVLGPNDSNLPYLELLLGTELKVRGTAVISERASYAFPSFMKRLEDLALERGVLQEAEIFMVWQAVSEPDAAMEKDRLVIAAAGRTIYPKSSEQKRMFRALRESDVVLASGPAGTGKTFISVIWALSQVLSGRKGKLLLTRPVVEAGESLGFLPGDMQQKLNPYLRPLYDAMEYVISPQQIRRMEENGSIEVAPLAYMRGRSVSNAVMILDEAQNATRAQTMMFLTRLGENSQAIVAGDPSQTDLGDRRSSGLEDAMATLGGIEGISVIRFTHSDTVRSRIVRDIVRAYSGRRDEAE